MEESFENEKPINYPTIQDLQNLEIECETLGRGDIVHEIKFHLGILKRVMKKVSEEGWKDYLLASWNEESIEIRKLITKIRLDAPKKI